MVWNIKLRYAICVLKMFTELTYALLERRVMHFPKNLKAERARQLNV